MLMPLPRIDYATHWRRSSKRPFSRTLPPRSPLHGITARQMAASFRGGVVKNDNKKTKGVIDLGGELAPGTVPFSTQLEECEAWVVGTERVYISVPKEAQPGPIKSIVWIARNVDHAPEIAPRYIGWFAHGR